jgi:hypothetical protein
MRSQTWRRRLARARGGFSPRSTALESREKVSQLIRKRVEENFRLAEIRREPRPDEPEGSSQDPARELPDQGRVPARNQGSGCFAPQLPQMEEPRQVSARFEIAVDRELAGARG